MIINTFYLYYNYTIEQIAYQQKEEHIFEQVFVMIYSSKHMIHEKDVYPPLLELIKESNGEMLFVDSDDERFSTTKFFL